MNLITGKKYLQIAFNRPLNEVAQMIGLLPVSERILIEAGTPLIKKYGASAITFLRNWVYLRSRGQTYIVADLKCMDRAQTEVEIAARAGASAATCLALAPLETIDEFISQCQKNGIASMLDMLNVEFPFEILGKLRELPKVVVLHRAADEADNKEKELPFHQIEEIKSVYDVLISVAGGESVKEVGQALFNDADIVVVWRQFYDKPGKMAELAREFLREIR